MSNKPLGKLDDIKYHRSNKTSRPGAVGTFIRHALSLVSLMPSIFIVSCTSEGHIPEKEGVISEHQNEETILYNIITKSLKGKLEKFEDTENGRVYCSNEIIPLVEFLKNGGLMPNLDQPGVYIEITEGRKIEYIFFNEPETGKDIVFLFKQDNNKTIVGIGVEGGLLHMYEKEGDLVTKTVLKDGNVLSETEMTVNPFAKYAALAATMDEKYK